jgi:hypothetical protein
LLAKVMGISFSSNKEKINFYKSEEFHRLHNSNVGDTTIYDEISQLLPNHSLSTLSKKPTRYWPNEPIEVTPLDIAAGKAAEMLKGFIDSIAQRYNIMQPVTAGKDSRLLLAGSKEIVKEVFYYINLESRLTERSMDIRISRKLLNRLNLEYHILDLPKEIPLEFRQMYFENNPHGSEFFLPHIYNYYLNFQDRVNCPGNLASNPLKVNKIEEDNVNGKTLAGLYNLEGYDYAVQYYTRWLEGCMHLCKAYKIKILNLWYWEERLANWGTQIQIDKDIAQEDINPFNSRLFIQHFLSVKLSHNNIPDFKIHRRIIKKLWPELLRIPINPSMKNYFLRVLKLLGLFNIAVKLRYKSAR